jgi:hypothetical protein
VTEAPPDQVAPEPGQAADEIFEVLEVVESTIEPAMRPTSEPTIDRVSGWYPDPDDVGGLRFWSGTEWTEHRARLAEPASPSPPVPAAPVPNVATVPDVAAVPTSAANNPAVCSCGVVAVGSCRVCSRPFCRAHISDLPTEDRAFLLRWDAWTCASCIEIDQRSARAFQLARCESLAAQIATIPKMSRVRTITGLRPRMANMFHRSDIAGVRPARHARAYLIEYDAGEPDSTYVGLAISADGRTIFDVGAAMSGVTKARMGPQATIKGYLIRKEITVDALREASARSTKDSWFEFASRAYLRAGKRLGIAPVDNGS